MSFATHLAIGLAIATSGRGGSSDETHAAVNVVAAQLPVDHPVGEPREFQPIEDPKGSLAAFYSALARTDAGAAGAITRVLHMGDSSIGVDGLPHAIRSRLQDRFGDGGAGFVLLGRPTGNYKNQAVTFRAFEGWDICYIAYLCKKDGYYGLGGHTFRSRAGGARSTIATAKRGAYGTEVARFELWYAAHPKGGKVSIRVDNGEIQSIDTAADTLEDRWYEVTVDPGAHAFTVNARGAIRLYGAVLETDGPGVVWDTVSMIGAFTKRLHGYDPTHIAVQIAHRDPHLLVLSYGGNDLRRLVTRAVTPDAYVDELRKVIASLRLGKPSMSCLVVGVVDHGRSGLCTVKPDHVDAMIDAQRRAAFAEGCAFFDTVAAMGGAGSLRKWTTRSPPLAARDLKHLNQRGRDLLGKLIYDALVAGFEARHG
jgi:lysophospholipase L1-like esterase